MSEHGGILFFHELRFRLRPNKLFANSHFFHGYLRMTRRSCQVVFVSGWVALSCSLSAPEVTAAPSNFEVSIPVTADKSCEFGDVVFRDEMLGTGPSRIDTEQWTNILLKQAAEHCANGSMFSITRKTYGARAHDVFQVAALLCQRPEIKETKVEDKGRERGTLNFTCTVTKLDEIRAKVARGEKIFSWATDRVPPRPADDDERGRREWELKAREQASSGTPARAGAVKPRVDPQDCSVQANATSNFCKSLFLGGIR